MTPGQQCPHPPSRSPTGSTHSEQNQVLVSASILQSQTDSSHQIHFTVTNISQPNYASSELWSRGLRNKSCHLLSAFPCQAISFAHGRPNHPQTVLYNLVITTPSATELLVTSGHPSTLGTSSHTPLVSQVQSEGSLNIRQALPGEVLSTYPRGAESWEK